MNNNKHQIRIIGGQWRGSKLAVMDEEGLRPTGDRVRETLFNWLAADIYEANCLDLFAGSGALGFEALSRGAKKVDAYENSQHALQQLRQSREKLGADSLNIFAKSALSQPPSGSEPYDLVFLDPPFGKDLMGPAIAWLESNQLIAEHGLIYIEQASSEPAPTTPEPWICTKEKRFGAVQVWLYRNQLLN